MLCPCPVCSVPWDTELAAWVRDEPGSRLQSRQLRLNDFPGVEPKDSAAACKMPTPWIGGREGRKFSHCGPQSPGVLPPSSTVLEVGGVSIQAADPTFGQGKPHGCHWAADSPCILQNLPLALVCPKEPPYAAHQSKIWTPLGVLVGFQELTISRTGGRRPLGSGQQAAKPLSTP